jgi:hypothetical protein
MLRALLLGLLCVLALGSVILLPVGGCSPARSRGGSGGGGPGDEDASEPDTGDQAPSWLADGGWRLALDVGPVTTPAECGQYYHPDPPDGRLHWIVCPTITTLVSGELRCVQGSEVKPCVVLERCQAMAYQVQGECVVEPTDT